MKLNLNHLFVVILFVYSISGCTPKDTTDDTDRIKQEDLFKNYIANIKDKLYKTNGGLYYIVKYNGGKDTLNDKDTLKANEWVRFNFSGYVLNSDQTLSLIETNIDSIAVNNNATSVTLFQFPLWFQLSSDKILGLRQGILLMKKYSKYQFIIPYSLALGGNLSSDGKIPPYATLIYNVELVEKIKNPYLRDSAIFSLKATNGFTSDTTDVSKNSYGNKIIDIYCKITTPRSGNDTLKSGDKISIQYTLRMIDNTFYFLNKSNSVIDTITVGSRAIIPNGGLDNALLYKGFKFGIGSSATILIRYPHAFGVSGLSNKSHQMVVPPYTSVEMNVQDIKIIKTK